MRRVITISVLLSALGCGPVEIEADEVGLVAQQFVQSQATRRQALEDSLVTSENGYAQLRLTRYTEDGWAGLPVWNPRVQPVRQQGTVSADAWHAIDVDAVPWDAESLRALGEYAFFNFPGQLKPALQGAFDDPEAVGLSVDNGVIETLVWVDTEGGPQPAVTCATCHSRRDSAGTRIAGRPNARFDLGHIIDQRVGGGSLAGLWGPGRVDVTGDGLHNPTAIPDLRPISFQTYLHRAATLHNDLTALAVRIETLMITSRRQRMRPPRKLAFAIAWYLWSLSDELSEPDWEHPGAPLFQANCAGCHQGDRLVGDRVALEAIGTPSAVGESPDRGTGFYRVPSLRGVGDREPLFASGTVPNLETLLSPDREVAGHQFGLHLNESDRALLISFLRTL